MQRGAAIFTFAPCVYSKPRAGNTVVVSRASMDTLISTWASRKCVCNVCCVCKMCV